VAPVAFPGSYCPAGRSPLPPTHVLDPYDAMRSTWVVLSPSQLARLTPVQLDLVRQASRDPHVSAVVSNAGSATVVTAIVSASDYQPPDAVRQAASLRRALLLLDRTTARTRFSDCRSRVPARARRAPRGRRVRVARGSSRGSPREPDEPEPPLGRPAARHSSRIAAKSSQAARSFSKRRSHSSHTTARRCGPEFESRRPDSRKGW
jgi:hypothetical protein